ncbi:MAG TPA: hypothetical protein VKT33_02935 [Candidatus Angelobacter sp.]|nr:hypothetical protein [Candidatus Angelobacter sp.]
MKRFLVSAALGLMALVLFGQEHNHEQAGQTPNGQSELNATTEAMGRSHNHEEHEHMAAHMHMTELRKAQSGDSAKAQQVVDQARPALEKYRDYRVALDEGYRIFLPNVPQKMYHFTNYQYAIGEAFRFDPTKPTSLLYEKHGDDYKLIGAMYTAPVRFSEQQLNERIPLSMAQWHQHVNMCKPPKGREYEALRKDAKFGLNGSITTQEACEAAGGTFMPHVFGWMVHMYPWEKTPDEIWSLERQLKEKPGSEHEHHDHGDMAGMEHKH